MYRSKPVSRFLCILVTVFLAFQITAAVYSASVEFKDTKGHWAEQDIEKYAGQGIISGYSDGTFRPDNYITRAEFITILNKFFNLTQTADIGFKDVPENAWYRLQIQQAVKEGYVIGFTDNTFKPDEFITRQEAAMIICRLLKLDLSQAGTESEQFKDGKAVPGWSKGALNAMIRHKLFKGYPDNTLGYAKFLTRAEILSLLNNITEFRLGNIPKIESVKINNNGLVSIDFNKKVRGLTEKDFEVTAKLDGQPYTLINLQFNEPSNSFTFSPIPRKYINQTLEIAIKGISEKATGSAADTFIINAYEITPGISQTASPAAIPGSGTYEAAQTVILSSATSGAEIYYTLDGSDPTNSSNAARTKYTQAISISLTSTVKAYAVKSGYNDSNISVFQYTISIPAVAAPVANPASGTYTAVQQVTLTSATPNALIYYTTDGSDPYVANNPARAEYAAPITVAESGSIKAYAVLENMTASSVVTFNYTINLQNTGLEQVPHMVAAGFTHTLFIDNGYVYTIGYGGYTPYDSIYTPLKINDPNLVNIVSVSAGEDFSIALRADGTVWAWGINSSGELGIGDDTSPSEGIAPSRVQNLSNIVAIEAGSSHSIALKADGTVWAWGYNRNGQCGIGDYTEDILEPLPVMTDAQNYLTGVKAVSAGAYKSMALKEDGSLWAWGENNMGYGITPFLGVGSTAADIYYPERVKGSDGTSYLEGVTAVSTGTYGSAAVVGGHVYTWGETFGRSTEVTPASLPGLVEGIEDVISVETGGAWQYSLLMETANGNLYGMGSNEGGQLGQDFNTVFHVNVPVLVMEDIISYDAGGEDGATIVVDSNHVVWGFGNNNADMLLDGEFYFFTPRWLWPPV